MTHVHPREDGLQPAAALTDLTGEIDVVVPRTRPNPAGAREPGQPHPRRHLIFAIVALALFMSSVDQTIVSTALSTIQRELHSGIEWSGWTITVYSLAQIVVMPIAGKLSDLFGRKRVFLIAVVLFTAASLACGLVSNIYVLVALRAVQAIGGGAFMPSATGIVADHYGHNRDRAIGMFASIFPIGGIVGPIMGGLFVTGWSWRGIFLVNVPIGILLLVLGLIFIPRIAPRRAARVDIQGVVLLGAFLLSMMLGITSLGDPHHGMLAPTFLVPEAVAAVALVLFLRHSSRGRDPFIPMELLRGRGFGVMNAINFLYGAAALGFGALVPLYAQDRFDIPVLQAGTLLTARAIGMICVAGLAVMALRRTGYRLPMIVGFVIVSGGLVGMALAPASIPAYAWLSIAGGVTGVGMGLSVPASNNATLGLAPQHLASITGLRGMFRQGGAIVSVTIVTALLARSGDQGHTLEIALFVFGCLLVASIPLVFFVPNKKGRW